TVKPYMLSPVTREVLSITTGKPQLLVLDGPDVERLGGKRVAIVDDVVSTGGTLDGLKDLLRSVGADVVTTLVVFTEGDPREDVVALGDLPLFPAAGAREACRRPRGALCERGAGLEPGRQGGHQGQALHRRRRRRGREPEARWPRAPEGPLPVP